jgi:hypothetical protein
MTATAIPLERLQIGRVLQGTFGALGRNWWRILILALPLEFAPEIASMWLKAKLVPLDFGALTLVLRPAIRSWVDMAVSLAPDTVMSVYFCRWAAAELEGARKTFALGDLRRLAALLLATLLADVAVGLGNLLLLIPGMLLGLLWVALSPVVVLEGAGPLQGLSRSAALTKRSRFRLVLLLVIYLACDFVVRLAVRMAMGLVGPLLGPQYFLSVLAPLSLLSSALISTFWALMWGAGAPVIYFELVRLKSGLGGLNPATVFD